MAKKKEINFEEGLQRLREIVEALEQGAATLKETLALYEEGVKLAADLNTILSDVETRVEELSAGLGADELPGDDSPLDGEIPVPTEESGEENGGLF